MKLIQISPTVWINADAITYYDETSEYLHFNDGEKMRVPKKTFRDVVAGLKEIVRKKKTAGNKE